MQKWSLVHKPGNAIPMKSALNCLQLAPRSVHDEANNRNGIGLLLHLLHAWVFPSGTWDHSGVVYFLVTKRVFACGERKPQFWQDGDKTHSFNCEWGGIFLGKIKLLFLKEAKMCFLGHEQSDARSRF